MKKVIQKLRRHSRYAKSKAGATLVELVAVIAILAIISTTCLSGMFAMTKVAVHGNRVSESQRTCALLNQQLSIYGNTAVQLGAYTSAPTYKRYDAVNVPDGFMNVQQGYGDKMDMFIYADPSRDNTIVFGSFDTTVSPYGVKKITTVEHIKQIDFTLKRLNIDPPIDKYLLEYTITTIYGTSTNPYSYEITGGVVLNNFTTGSSFNGLTLGDKFTITTKSGGTAASTNYLRVRTTNRQDVNRG